MDIFIKVIIIIAESVGVIILSIILWKRLKRLPKLPPGDDLDA
jgi:hypothetical protein